MTVQTPTQTPEGLALRMTGDIVIVGGGAAGIGLASSLLRRQPELAIIIIEPSAQHFYQPAWTLVGAGEVASAQTVRPTAALMPRQVNWIQAAVQELDPEQLCVRLDNGVQVAYRYLVLAPGLKLDWDAIEGLSATLGQHCVTSNYRFDLAPYTWSLVQALRSGRAIFTQPPMPIKCAGAPQKALYLSCSYWQRQGVLGQIEVAFETAGAALFGVAAFVPTLLTYFKRYGAQLNLNSTLVAVDGPARKAWFAVTDGAGVTSRIEKSFDLLHVVPPQTAHDFVKNSSLANAAGWVEVDPATLQHVRVNNVFSLGDACSAPNAKTAAAVRKQIVVVADNLLARRRGASLDRRYDGYGACPLTVEKGKVVLAEFAYGGKLVPTFFSDPTKPRRTAWLLNKWLLPVVYWQALLKGREWLAGSAKS